MKTSDPCSISVSSVAKNVFAVLSVVQVGGSLLRGGLNLLPRGEGFVELGEGLGGEDAGVAGDFLLGALDEPVRLLAFRAQRLGQPRSACFNPSRRIRLP